MTTAAVTRAPGVAFDRPRWDVPMLIVVLALLSFGVVMVYSSSAVYAGSRIGDGAFFLKRQAIAAVLGVVAMAGVMRLGYRRLEMLSWVLLIGSTLLLIATLVPGLGQKAGGAQRWLRVGGFQVQPAEFLKLALCVHLARWASRKGDRLGSFRKGVLPHAVVLGVLGLILLQQPDFGSLVVLVLVTFAVLMVAGIRWRYVLGAAAVVIPAGVALIVSSPYRMRRIAAFLDPFEDRYGAGYQVAEALMSMGSGGLFGLGLGDGRQKLGFLPAGHTDYILASIGEELGLLGVGSVLLLFAVLIVRGTRAALRAGDPFGAYLAVAITSLLAFEVVINAGMCLALLPPKGLAMPFLSYGGTQVVKSMLAAGVLLSVSEGEGGYLAPPMGATRWE